MNTNENRTALIAGAGGFIGGHLAAELLARGYAWVRCVDVKPAENWYQSHPGAENLVLDLRDLEACRTACRGVSEVYNLACDMGGIGFIENHKAECMISVLINTHLLMAAREYGVKNYFYSSSACVYNGTKQTDANVTALTEADAYPAEPEDGYGWEKLFSERMCRHFEEDYGMQVTVARFHNVYGPFGTYEGGREKAPAAICRKVIAAKTTGEHTIEIWGDGDQTRSFMYIDDCVDGIIRLMESDCSEPINLGSSELISINELVTMVEEIASITLERNHDLTAPKGVRGRNSDNTMIMDRIGWEPTIALKTGMAKTYAWILDQMTGATPAPFPNEAPEWLDTSSSTSSTGQTSQAQANI
ncbi:MAG: GDP-D-mannose 3',5'-epimerase [Planctomycetota bacterium]|jgi:GDP-D-mannose 3',5'-epimerase